MQFLQLLIVYLFDLDDTIIDSSIYSRMYLELIEKLKAAVGEEKVDSMAESLKKGEKRPDTYELSKALGQTELYYKVLEQAIARTYSLKSPVITKIFKSLNVRKKKIGIVSNSQARTINLFLEKFLLLQYVDFVESGRKETVFFWHEVERKHSLYKPNTLVIDDNADVLALVSRAGYNVMSSKDMPKLLEEVAN
ncbi:MAG: HAD hydrolase-like protein [Nanoarchaeota archaeon]|nr:HAD hydrolase-like protein [Nanoarchaeota archaeon]